MTTRMAISLFPLLILLILEGISDAADDCSGVLWKSFEGDEIPGAGSRFDTSGDWTRDSRVQRGQIDCQELCRGESTAKAWSLQAFDNPKCLCYKTVKKSTASRDFKSGKFCDCNILKYHPSIHGAKSYSLPAFCQTPTGATVAATSTLPHGTRCNLTCDGSYEGAPGSLSCRARDWDLAGDRIKMMPAPLCRLNSTAIMYSSIGGGLGLLLVAFLVVVCCLRRKQNRERYRGDGGENEDDDDDEVTMRSHHERGGGGGGEGDMDDGGADRRRSYKKATGHLSVDEENREADLMIKGRQDRIVYANVDLSDGDNRAPRSRGGEEPVNKIGVPDAAPIYLEGNILNEDKNEYVSVDYNT